MESKVDSNGRSHYCKNCDKYYSSYKSLWKHNKNIHKGDIPNNSNNILKSSNEILNNSNEVLTNSNIIPLIVENNKEYNCRCCNKIFINIKTRWAHEQKCKKEKDKKDQLEIEKIKLEQLKQEATIIKEENKKAEIEVKKINAEIKLAKLNGTITNSHNTTTTNSHNTQINNGVINNTFYKLGDIPFDTLSKKDRDEIFNSPNMIETSIKKLHLNPLRPELCNIFISSLKDPYCIVFDGTQFIIKLKSEVLPDVVDMHLFEFELAKTKYNLNDATVNKIDKLDFKINKNTKKYTDENDRVYKNFKEYMVEVVKILIYNFCDKDMLEKIKKIKIFVRKELEEDSSDDNYDEFILNIN